MASNHNRKSTMQPVPPGKNPGRPTQASYQNSVFKMRKLRLLIIGLLAAYSRPELYAGPVFPEPCAGGACGVKTINTNFVEVGTLGNGGLPLIVGNKMTIQQLSNQAVLNWASFNLSKDASVIFNQPSATASVLNRIWSADPSLIAGKISANGQVYLINTNGIVFANGAQVDTGALVASTLNITNDLFLNGILSDNAGSVIPAAFSAQNGVAGDITVEGGAILNSASGGRIFLFAPQITNNGTITTPDGQTILAAGKQVYLAASSDPGMRGLLVQVNADALAANGTVTNNGTISADRGNVTLAGLLVNQRGTARATTSVNANGSIYLQAGDVSKSTNTIGVPDQFYTGGALDNENGVAVTLPGKALLLPTVGGTVTLGAGSKTEVLLDATDKATITDKQVFQQSNIGLVGKNIILEGKTGTLAGAQVTAKAGLVTALAAEDPYQSQVNDNNLAEVAKDSSRIYVGDGAKIDVSGVKNVQLKRQLLEVELRSSQLADAPLLRNGFLNGKTILVDPMQGTTLTDISPNLQNIGRGIEEKSTVAGSIRLDSRGDVITRSGSVLDVSGGSIQYSKTDAATTKLMGANGVVYDVATAPKDIEYIGFANKYTYVDNRYGKSTSITDAKILPGYLEGKSAGNIAVLAGSAYLRGDTLATTVTGVYQRLANSLPEGGHFTLGDKAMLGSPEALKDVRIGDVQFVNTVTDSLGNFDALNDSLSPQDASTTLLSASQLGSQGMNHLDIYSNGVVSVPSSTPITLSGHGSFSVTASAVNIDSAIVIPDGTVNLTAKANLKAPQAVANDVHLSSNAVISTAGQWVNDSPLAKQPATPPPLLIDGGTVNLLAANNVKLDQGSVVNVSGGAWLDGNGKLSAGKGGNLTIKANEGQLLGANESIGKVSLDGTIRGDSFDQAGTLSISSGYLTIGDHALNKAGELWLTSNFFNQGFGAYNLVGTDGVTVLANTSIAPRQHNLVLKRDAVYVASGSDMTSVANVALLPEINRHAADISLSSTHYAPALTNQFGNVLLDQGASISTDAGATVTLTARESLTVLGNIDAPAGKITLEIAKGVKAGDQESDQDGYRADQRLLIGASASITAQAKVVKNLPTANGLQTGKVLDAGTISLIANKGSVVTESGSTLDVSGKYATFDIQNKNKLAGTVTAVGKAGEIDIHAYESLSLKGKLVGNAANVAGAQGGSLTIGLDNYDRKVNPNDTPVSGAPLYPTNDRVLTITSDAALANASGIQNGVAVVNVDVIKQGNFDNVTLKSTDVIAFNGNVSLSNKQSIQIDAPVIQGDTNAQAVFNSSYVAIGNADRSRQLAGNDTLAPVSGNATLTVQANLIDVQNKSTLTGFDQLSLVSTGDIRFDVNPEIVNLKADFNGSLKTSADILLKAAQIYPTTHSTFTINPGSAGNYALGNITIEQNGTSKVPLSAGGSLIMNATNIYQNGTIRASIGSIQLNATDSLELGAGSLTSVSAEGLTIPYGFTQNSQEWLYGVLFSQDKVVQSEVVSTLPSKEISISAPTIVQKSGATVDISGGGDLYAYEFIAGTGGTKDVLSLGANEYTAAIVPSLGNAYAPVDHQYAAGSELKVGTSVYLKGVPGLKEGFYTLLPARYALLEGAYAVKLIQPNSNIALGTTVKQADGSFWVAAKNAVNHTDILDSATSTVQLTPGAVVRTQSQYVESKANTFYTNQATSNGTVKPRTPQDAGQFVASAIDKLVLDGVFKTTAVNNGRGGDISILSNHIRVVDTVGPDDGTLQLSTATLNNLQSESLLLGAKRTTTADGDQLTVTANSIEVNNDKATPLKTKELILAAKETVTVKAGSGIEAKASSNSSNPSANDLLVEGDGALLRLSAGEQALVKRQNVAGIAGLLDIQSVTSLDVGTGSINFDATSNTNIAESSSVIARSINIASGKISVGDVPANTNGLLLTEGLLNRFDGLKNLGLHSYSSLNLYDNAALGSAVNPLTSLSIDARAILGFGHTEKSINAGQLTLLNSNGSPVVETGTGSGGLTVNVQQAQSSGRLISGDGNKTIEGFGQVDINVAQDVLGQGSGSLNLNNAGNLTLTTARLSVAAGADLALSNQTGDIRLLSPGVATTLANAVQAGGQLTVTANAVTVNSLVDLPSGSVTLNAKAGDVTIGQQGAVQANGFTKTFGKTVTSYANAGNITLNSDQGNVIIASGGKLDVSAAGNANGTQGGKAGKLTIAASNGLLDNQGSITGTPKPGNTGASFSLDANAITSVSGLNTQLAQGGFSGDIALRARTGDLTVASNDVIKASSVTLTADGGNVQVDGKIDTKNTVQGNISVWARDNITLANGSKISTVGGDVSLGSQSGILDLQTGAEVSLKGTSALADGQLTLRAARTANNSDVKINTIGATVDSGQKIIVEGVKTYQQAIPNFASTAAGSIRTETSDFANNASTISTRLITDPSKIQVRAGIEVTSTGDMTVNSTLDLRGIPSLRVNAVPINLTLRAAGDLVVNASISDGFASAATTAIQATGDSASYRFTAGADFNSANPLATVKTDGMTDTGNFVLTPNNLIRTGNGNIDIAAANDIRLGYSTASQDYSDVNAQKSVIYTAGVPSAAINNFSIPLRVNGRQTLDATYPTDGGDITLRAGKDIRSAETNQFISNWLWRRGRLSADGQTFDTTGFGVNRRGLNTSWWVAYDQFQQGIGALGGGNISLDAGHDVINVSAVIPTSGRVAAAIGVAPTAADIIITGGGNLNVTAGNDIKSGLFEVDKGTANLTANGAFSYERTGLDGSPLYPILAYADTQINANARTDLTITTLVNSTMVPQANTNKLVSPSYFYTVGSTSSLNVSSVGGNVNLPTNVDTINQTILDDKFESITQSNNWTVYPTILDVTAFSANANVSGRLFPSATGNLQVRAANDVTIQNTMLESNPIRASVLFPTQSGNSGDVLLELIKPSTPLHLNDSAAAYVIADKGDINGDLIIAKPVSVQAGHDIKDFNLVAKNLNSTDITSVTAGNNISYSITRSELSNNITSNPDGISIEGPGQLAVIAAGDIDLGNSAGIVSRGNLADARLAAKGATLIVSAGVGTNADGSIREPDYQAFIEKYLTNADSAYQTQLINYIREIKHIQTPLLADQNAEYALRSAEFQALSRQAQMPLIASVLYKELQATGIDHNTKGTSYDRGYLAIETLFPSKENNQPLKYDGGINLAFSQIKTEQGGDISLLVPGGGVTVGYPNPPAELNDAKRNGTIPAEANLGLLALSDGAIRAFARDSFTVNQSRILTLQGGDILLWTSTGDIDAGKGAKTVSAAPPPVIQTDANGNVFVNPSGAVSGSGVGQLLTKAGITAGTVDLLAPTGTVNAGDAGIRVAGNLNIGALVVIGADNIKVSGTATGVPLSSVGASVGALSAASAVGDATKAVTDKLAGGLGNNQLPNDAIKKLMPSILTFKLLGLGDFDL